MRRITIDEAARRASVSLSTLRKHVYGQRLSPLLLGFPEPCARGRRLLWLDVDIDAWLAAQSTFVSDEVVPPVLHSFVVAKPKAGPGRPRKAERP
jgi:predicted DNA-binding transcriptional regulator AlpA